MSILVRGMEMPKTCAYCRFIYADPNIEYEQPDGTKMVGGCCCCFTGNVIWNTKRDDDCPLGEVKTPHGRLIDEEAVIDHFVSLSNNEWNQNVSTSWANAFAEAASDICDIPTIIEAEVET